MNIIQFGFENNTAMWGGAINYIQANSAAITTRFLNFHVILIVILSFLLHFDLFILFCYLHIFSQFESHTDF